MARFWPIDEVWLRAHAGRSGEYLLLDALLHPVRLNILALLLERGGMYPAQIAEELKMDAGEVVCGLKILERAGLVASRIESVEPGKFAKFYSADRERLGEAMKLAERLLERIRARLGGIACHGERA